MAIRYLDDPPVLEEPSKIRYLDEPPPAAAAGQPKIRYLDETIQAKPETIRYLDESKPPETETKKSFLDVLKHPIDAVKDAASSAFPRFLNYRESRDVLKQPRENVPYTEPSLVAPEARFPQSLPEQMAEERLKKDLPYVESPTVPEYQKKSELLDKILHKAPSLAITAANPAAGLIFEGIQQLKNVGLSLANETPYNPLDSKAVLSKDEGILPESTPEWLAVSLGIAENLGDMALMAKVQDWGSKGLFRQTMETVGNKLVEAGYPQKRVEQFLSNVGESARPADIGVEAKRLLKARGTEVPLASERRIGVDPGFPGYETGLPGPGSSGPGGPRPRGPRTPPAAPVVTEADMPSAEFSAAMTMKYGDQAGFYVPGVGFETGTERMMVLARKLSQILNITETHVLDSLSNAAAVYEQGMGQTLDEGHVRAQANAAFWNGIPITAAMSKMGIVKDPEALSRLTGAIAGGDEAANRQLFEAIVGLDPALDSVLPAVREAQAYRAAQEEAQVLAQEEERVRQEYRRRRAEKLGPQGIVRFIRDRGGINPKAPESSDIREFGRMDLMNTKGGVSADRMREALQEAGFLPEGSTINDLWDALDEEIRTGRKKLSVQDAEGVDAEIDRRIREHEQDLADQAQQAAELTPEEEAEYRRYEEEISGVAEKGKEYNPSAAENFRLPTDAESTPSAEKPAELNPPEERKYSSTQVNLPEAAAGAVRDLAAAIPDADLAPDGRETNPHITVKFGIHGDQVDAVRAALENEPPVTVTLGETSFFPDSQSESGDVVKIDVDSPGLHRLNEIIKDAVPTTDTHPTYQPHVTLAYVKPGLGEKYAGDDSLAGTEITFDYIIFSGRNGEDRVIELKGQPGGDLAEPGARYNPQPVFYSGLQRIVEQKMPNSASVNQIRSILSSAKKEEVDWSGIMEWLEEKERAGIAPGSSLSGTSPETVSGSGSLPFSGSFQSTPGFPGDTTSKNISKAGMISKREILDFLKANEVQVTEVVKQDIKDENFNLESEAHFLAERRGHVWDQLPPSLQDEFIQMASQEQEFSGRRGFVESTEFSRYQLPGGENYRELLLTLPYEKIPGRGLMAGQPASKTFKSSHFDEPNVLAHVRFNDRTDADGNKVLFIEEIQSDWHQKGRKEGYDDVALRQRIADAQKELDAIPLKSEGFKTLGGPLRIERFVPVKKSEGVFYHVALNRAERFKELTADIERYKRRRLTAVPDAPFKKTWHELALKRVLRYAAENGYDAVAWTTGEQQAERYDLSKQVDYVSAGRNADGTFDIDAVYGGRSAVKRENVRAPDLPDLIGKDLAKKISEQTENYVEYSGLDLKVGGEGMKGFYDQIIPAFLNKYAKKWGGRVGIVEIDAGGFSGDQEDFEAGRGHSILDKVHSLAITPAMRSEVMEQGQPLFERGASAPAESQVAPVKDVPEPPADLADTYVETQLREAGFVQTHTLQAPTPEDIAAIHYELENKTQENVYITMLDAQDKIIAVSHVAMGTTDRANIDKKVLFGTAQKAGARKIILVHNHPSGDVRASSEDVQLTRELAEAARDLGMEVSYHVIIDHGEFGVIQPDGAASIRKLGEAGPKKFQVQLVELAQSVKGKGLYKGQAVTSSERVARLAAEIMDPEKKTLYAVVLDAKLGVNGIVPIKTGSAAGPEIVRPVFEAATQHAGKRVVFVANSRMIGEKEYGEIKGRLRGLGVDVLDSVVSSASGEKIESMGDWEGQAGPGKAEVREKKRRWESTDARLIKRALKLKESLGISEADWTRLKMKAVKKASMASMSTEEMLKVYGVLRDIKAGHYKLENYLAGTYEFKRPTPVPGPAQVTEIEKFFGQDRPLPETVIDPRVSREQSVKGQVLDLFGVRSRQQSLAASGDFGKTFVREIQDALFLPSAKAGEWNARLQDIQKENPLSAEDIFNLKESLEGRAKPNARVKKMHDEMRARLDEVRKLVDRQINEDPNQPALIKAERVWGLENYYPHVLGNPKELYPGTATRKERIEDMVRRGAVVSDDPAKRTAAQQAEQMIDDWVSYNETPDHTPMVLVDYLIETGQASDANEALLMLSRAREFSRNQQIPKNFLHREADLPFYDPNPLRVIPEYNKRALNYLYLVERFGRANQKLMTMVEMIDRSGGNKNISNAVMDYITGKEVEGGDGKKILQFLRNVQVIEKMSYSALSNYIQGRAGLELILGHSITEKAREEIARNPDGVKRFAVDVGQNPEMAQLFDRNEMDDWVKVFLKAVLFSKTETDNYILATTGGRVGALSLLERLKKNPRDSFARAKMAVLGIDPTAALKKGYLEQLELKRAGYRAWKLSQSIPDILNQPHRWFGFRTDSQWGRTIFQFKTVAYRQAHIVVEFALKEALRGRISPLLKLMLVFPILGEILEDIKALISRRERAHGLIPRYLESLAGAYAFGIINEIFYFTKLGKIDLGATVGQMGELFGVAGELTGIKPGWNSTKKAVSNIPLVGRPAYGWLLRGKAKDRPKSVKDIIFPKLKKGEGLVMGKYKKDWRKFFPTPKKSPALPAELRGDFGGEKSEWMSK